jgi:hypothetical protein
VSLNDPIPKGDYRAVLEIVDILGENGSQTVKELVPKLEKFGYRIETDDSGVKRSKALSPGGHTYLEITEVLEFVEAKGNDDDPLETELALTEEAKNSYNIDTSGERIYSLLKSDELNPESKRGAISALILSRLSENDINTSNLSIPHAFQTFLTKVWEQQDESTGRYQTNWNLDEILTDPDLSGDWNKEKLRHCRQRAIDLGICHRGSGTGNKDVLYPVLAQDLFQAVVYFLNQYYKKSLSDSTPNMNDFYEDLEKWYPIDRRFFEQNVLYDGLLHQNTEITSESYPVLFELLNRNQNEKQYQVSWFEGEDSWNENIRFAEFEIGVMQNAE